MESQVDTSTVVNDPQVATEIQSQQATATEQPNANGQGQPNYFESEYILKGRINELTRIAETGSQDEIAKAMEELSSIEDVLEKAKNNPTKQDEKPQPVQPSTPPQAVTQEVEGTSGDEDSAPKKFSVRWQGQKVEREDKNNLLGFKNTGELKAALIKSQLQLAEHESRSLNLLESLRKAEEKVTSYESRKLPPLQPQAVIRPATNRQKAEKPIPPSFPKLSTNDPSLYSEADITALDTYQKASNDFNQRLINYIASVESRPSPEFDETKQKLEEMDKRLREYSEQVEQEKKKIKEEQLDFEHWQRISNFQDKHDSFKTPLPIKQMNEIMGKWMDSVAAANGVRSNVEGQSYNDFMGKRAQVIKGYLDNDPEVTDNAKGLPPPEGYEAFFKLLELNKAWNKYTKNGADKELFTLDKVYWLMKHDSGEIEDNLDTIRTNERVRAAEQFSSGVKQLQRTAINIDPTKSSGGPDVNELGITNDDFNWFRSISPKRLQRLEVDRPEEFKKWQAIATKIESRFVH